MNWFDAMTCKVFAPSSDCSGLLERHSPGESGGVGQSEIPNDARKCLDTQVASQWRCAHRMAHRTSSNSPVACLMNSTVKGGMFFLSHTAQYNLKSSHLRVSSSKRETVSHRKETEAAQVQVWGWKKWSLISVYPFNSLHIPSLISATEASNLHLRFDAKIAEGQFKGEISKESARRFLAHPTC